MLGKSLFAFGCIVALLVPAAQCSVNVANGEFEAQGSTTDNYGFWLEIQDWYEMYDDPGWNTVLYTPGTGGGYDNNAAGMANQWAEGAIYQEIGTTEGLGGVTVSGVNWYRDDDPQGGDLEIEICYLPAASTWSGSDGIDIKSAPDVSCLAGRVVACPDNPGQTRSFELFFDVSGVNSDDRVFLRVNAVNTADYAYVDKLAVSASGHSPASNPAPASGAMDVSPVVDLSWDAPAGVVEPSYNVYFGTAESLAQVATGLTANSYDPGTLDYSGSYYWRVDVIDGTDVYSGEVWNFTTTPGTYADFGGDGVVQFADFAELAVAWQSVLGEPDFDEMYDLDEDGDVDMADLELLARAWLTGAKFPYAAPSSTREKLGFNTGWKFYKGDIAGDAAKEVSYNDSAWQTVNVPHNPPLSLSEPDPARPSWPNYSYEGVSWYRKHFDLEPDDEGKKIFIEFEAVNTVADVWVNGTHLTTHRGGYLPFTVDVTECVNFGGAENVIAVKADNTDDPDIPIGHPDWFNWGGMYRDVWLHITDRLYVTDAVRANVVAGGGVLVTYPFVTDSYARVQIKTHVRNEYAASKSCTVKNFIVDANNMVVASAIDTENISASGEHAFTQPATVINPLLWHPDHPHLYELYTQVYDDGVIVDCLASRIGIRRISFRRDEGFEINGERLVLRGTNRMQDFPYIGYAIGNLGHRRDAEKLKEAGFQFVRTSQYPHDPAFIEACDELGLLVLAPIPGFQHFGSGDFEAISYQNMRDLIRRDRNHPSVVLWELSLNETSFDSEYAANAVAIGHEEYPGDQMYVGGWMYIGVWHSAIYDVALRNADHDPSAWDYTGPLPLVINEYGHWRYRDDGENQTSDAHRAEGMPDGRDGGEAAMLGIASNHQESHNIQRGMANLSGDALWVGIDYACYPQGVLDNFRLPKFGYYFFQSQRDPELVVPGLDYGPMVYIANYWTSSSPTDVRVYSNCEQVRLYLNDSMVAVRSPDSGADCDNLVHPPFTFTGLTYEPGELKAEGLIDGEVASTHIVRTPGSAQSLSVKPDIAQVPANGSETVFVYASILDAEGTLVPAPYGAHEVNFEVSGPAELASPATINSEAGIATALIRVSDQPGTITVTATSSGLNSGSADITSQ